MQAGWRTLRGGHRRRLRAPCTLTERQPTRQLGDPDARAPHPATIIETRTHTPSRTKAPSLVVRVVKLELRLGLFVVCADASAAPHQVEHEADNRQNRKNCCIHYRPPNAPPIGPLALNAWTNLMMPGPRTTTKNAGNRQNTSGNTSLTPILAARSSARCRRLVRDTSA